MKDIQGRGERSRGAVQGAEVGGRGSTKERDDPLCSSPSSRGNPKQSWAQGKGGVERKSLLLLQSREEQGMADHPEGPQRCARGRGHRLHVERTEFWGRKHEKVAEAGPEAFLLLKFLK